MNQMESYYYCPTCEAKFELEFFFQQHNASQDHLDRQRALTETRFCETCSILLSSPQALKLHEFSLLHQSNLEEYWEPMGQYVCMDCRYNFLDYDNLQLHYVSQKHLVMEEDQFSHEVEANATTYCEVCKFELASAATWTTHKLSLLHQTNLGSDWKPLTEHVCTDCRFYFSTEHQLKLHLNSTKHADKMAAKQQQQQLPPRMIYCKACKQDFSISAMATHRFSLQHQFNLGDEWKPEGDHVCLDCRQFFTCASHLDAHLRSFRHLEQARLKSVAANHKSTVTMDKKSMFCAECNETVSGGAVGLHRFSLKHQTNLGSAWKPITEFVCTNCSFYFINAYDLSVHVNSPKHLDRPGNQVAPLAAPPREASNYMVRCEPCKLDMHAKGMSLHKFSLSHQTNLGEDWKPLTEHVCVPCRFYFSAAYHLQNHLTSQKHTDRITKLQGEQEAAVTTSNKNMVLCAPCNLELPASKFNVHKFSLLHQTNLGKDWAPLTKYVCVDCNFYFSGLYQLESHMGSQKHFDRIKLQQVPEARCDVCNMNFESSHALELHRFALSHQTALGSAWRPVGDFVCTTCRFNFNSAQALESHSATLRHLEELKFAPLADAQTECRCGLCDMDFVNSTVRRQHSFDLNHAMRKFELVALANAAFDSLDRMNEMLLDLGLAPVEQKYLAVLRLSEVHINVFDLILKRYQYRFSNAAELRVHAERNDLLFPIDNAHAEGLKVFLYKSLVGAVHAM